MLGDSFSGFVQVLFVFFSSFSEVIIDEVSLTCVYSTLCLYISLTNLQKAFYQTISTRTPRISPIQASLLRLTYALDSCQLTFQELLGLDRSRRQESIQGEDRLVGLFADGWPMPN